MIASGGDGTVGAVAGVLINTGERHLHLPTTTCISFLHLHVSAVVQLQNDMLDAPGQVGPCQFVISSSCDACVGRR